jgi:thioesterase domain-containing protein/acyl carrier protein
MQREPGFTAADTLVAVTTISFDIAVLELFLPLITGGRVVIASREMALDPTRLAALLAQARATVLQATPATWSGLIGINWRGQENLKALCGGEALKRSLADRLLALGLDLWNVYGPTETTIWSTLAHVEAGTGTISVGRPIANTTAYILDPQQQPVPIGVPGELYLGGLGVARGYRNRPELTAEKFVAPAVANGERIYRTGDYAIYRENGAIEIQGRSDNQVKIRGYRIELEDVEVNLTQHPRVAAAAAKAWPDPDGGFRLCAYLTGVEGAPPNAAELRQYLRGRVADYMIPSEIVALDALPLTSNGKVDRKQLREPERSATIAPQLDSTLAGEELRLARIWSELLRIEQITATDNFFDLGGHSLLLLKLVRLVNKEFAIELPMARLFQTPTIEKVAKLVRELQKQDADENWDTLVPLNPHGTKRPLFLVHSLMLYGRLPAALGDDQPFYALQPLPFEVHPANDYVERMLDDHVHQIKRVQPHGPYQIAGWCFAGWLAYEVARRLEASGDQVSLLALLDSWCPYKTGPATRPTCTESAQIASRRGLSGRLRSVAFKARFRLQQILALPGPERPGYLRRMIRDTWASLSIPIEREIKAFLYRLHRRFNFPLPAVLRDANVVTYSWLRDYRIQPYHGDITLIRPGDLAVPPDSDPHCGWRALTTGAITTRFVPGDRSTMFLGSNLSLLADVLRTLMEKR